MTSGTYSWSFLTQIFHSGQLSHGDVLVSSNTFIKGFLIGTTISYQLRDIYSICRCCWNVATYKWKVHSGNIYSDMLCSSVLFVFILCSVFPTYCHCLYLSILDRPLCFQCDIFALYKYINMTYSNFA